MFGAIIGDICGSVYEWNNFKTTNPPSVSLLESGCSFTDDSVLTFATADALLQKRGYAEAYKDWGHRYPRAGYGGNFARWLQSHSFEAYNSWGNGSAMRVSPVGWAFETLEETLAEAKRSAEVTHNHPEGIKGAQSVAAAIPGSTTASLFTNVEKFFSRSFSEIGGF
ncbi:MAG: ADP-ribosylglycohydrolase family protein [Planctomycetaceae bacterium]|nr:ADP-ribosylglycohydrolase family protein [Planctomycetaceae bacterium]